MGYSSILIILVATVNLILGKLILGEVRAKVSETNGRSIQLWGNSIIYIIGVICLGFVLFSESNSTILVKVFWAIFLIIALGFKAFMEWKYLKNYKKHVVTLSTLIVGITFTVLFVS